MSKGISAPNRRTLIVVLKPIVKVDRNVPDIHISLPCCGRVREWSSIEDLPAGNVGPCPCGNWFIKYIEEGSHD